MSGSAYSQKRRFESWHSTQVWWLIFQRLQRIICSTTYEVFISLKAPNHHPNKRILGRYPVSQMAMLNMSSLSSNLNCEPPLAVFLALEMHSQTRSKVGRTFTQIWSEHVRLMHTGDMDVIVILLSNLHHIKAMNLPVEIKIFFKAGKSTRMISLNTIATNLGMTTCKAMAFFHAFTGSDTTSSFKFKARDPSASWCTKCHSSWWNSQPSSTLHSKHHQEWKKWRQYLYIYILVYICIRVLCKCIVVDWVDVIHHLVSFLLTDNRRLG